MNLFKKEAPAEPLSGPLKCCISFRFPYRKSESKAQRELGDIPHDKRPDLDNLAKLYCDCLSKAGIIKDDGQIAELVLKKSWVEFPSVQISVIEISKP